MEKDAFEWAELPDRSAHFAFDCIGPREVRVTPVYGGFNRVQRFFLWLLDITPPVEFNVWFDLDVSRFPDGVEIGDIYQFKKTGQLFRVLNFSPKGNRIRLQTCTPTVKPSTQCVGHWVYYGIAFKEDK